MNDDTLNNKSKVMRTSIRKKSCLQVGKEVSTASTQQLPMHLLKGRYIISRKASNVMVVRRVGKTHLHLLRQSTECLRPISLPTKFSGQERWIPIRQMPIKIIPHQASSKSENSSELEMLYNNKVLKRPLFNVSTGMEKEEEKEHHLRQAIEAQRAQTAGAGSSNHFIPIRDVNNVDVKEYQAYSKWKAFEKPFDYVSQKKGVFDFDDSSYDCDEEDMQFLQENNFFITVDQYENIIEKLEMSSRERIPSLHEFYQQHSEFILENLELVYDFWISRRMKMIREFKTSIPLIPYVPSKNKLGEKIDPYVAFRHRGPKVTTRRKQKMDTEHYGTMLRLAATIRRTHILTKAMVQRDTLKLKMVESNTEMFEEELGFLEQGGTVSDLQTIYPRERQITTNIPYANKWLMKVWSEVARELFNTKPLNREENILAIATRHGPEDGRFAFHRIPSCTYRTHHTSDPNHQESSASRSRAIQAVKRKLADNMLDNQYDKAPRRIDNSEAESSVDLMDGYRSRFVSLNEDTWERLTGQRINTYCRSRFGRGGRLKLDFLYK
ncbi:Enhancer of polycomb-like protein [Aphelenchoides bicaudatus]|nr:Enhancer of polycomb-like protein [Aphelenchoides bicaudatus]